jgi:hypothetical protein
MTGGKTPPDINIDRREPGRRRRMRRSRKEHATPCRQRLQRCRGQGQEWELQGADANNKGGVWVLGQKTLEPKFQLNTMVP